MLSIPKIFFILPTRFVMETIYAMKQGTVIVGIIFLCTFGTPSKGHAQSVIQNPKLKIDHVHYRQAIWESEKLHEEPYAWPNHGGYVFVYFTNVADEPDWSHTPQQIFSSVEMTHLYNSSKPTMITLCRNGSMPHPPSTCRRREWLH